MFPSFVWRADLPLAASESIRARLDARLGALPPLTTGQSFQSEANLHEGGALGELLPAIERLAQSVVGFLKLSAEPLFITGCWANVNAAGARHPRHSHPNNYLSGAYYAKVQEGADTINFHDPRVQAAVIRPPVVELGGENADQAVIRVQTGSLLLFPAWLEHSVDPNQSDELRISVSFNLMFARYAESSSAPQWEPGLRG